MARKKGVGPASLQNFRRNENFCIDLYCLDRRVFFQIQFTDNNFTFNKKTPGVCKVKVKGTSGVKSEDPNLEWTLTQITGSTLTSDPDPAKGAKITFTYTILPTSNTQFGEKTLNLKHSQLPGGCKDTQTVEIFFTRDATNNPGGNDPNWYHYWSQALGVEGQHTYNGSLATSETTVTSATTWTIEIGSDANWPKGNPPTGETFINGFWATNLHEFWHRDHRVHNFSVHGHHGARYDRLPIDVDIDRDGICDREPGDPPGHNSGWEATIGTDPTEPNSTEDGANWAEEQGTYDHDALDWADVGSQSNN